MLVTNTGIVDDLARSPMRAARGFVWQAADDPTLKREVGLPKNSVVEIQRELGEALHNFGATQERREFWLDVKAAAEKVPALSQFEAVRRWLEQPVVASGAGETAATEPGRRPTRGKTKTVYKTPQGRPVQAAYRLPRHGRSSLLAGLLRGPWG